jgi:hypothetical protein
LTQSTTLRILKGKERGLFFCGILSSALKLIVRIGVEIDHLLIVSEVEYSNRLSNFRKRRRIEVTRRAVSEIGSEDE